MAAKDYSEIPEKKALANKPAAYAGMVTGKEQVSITYRCPSWGLKGAPKQRRDRSNGMRKVSARGKSEGLGADGIDDTYVKHLYGE